MKSTTKRKESKKFLQSNITAFLGCFLLCLFLFTSCSSDNNDSDSIVAEEELSSLAIEEAKEITEIDDTNENINEIIESTYLEVASTNFFKSSDYKNQQDNRFLSDCVLISKELKDGYVEIILDYGEGCITRKQHEAKGKIIIQMDPNMETRSIVLTYSFEDFFINDKEIEGSVEKKRSRSNDNGNPESQINKNVKITWDDGAYVTIEGMRTREWIEGKDNKLWGDNVFSITGNWTITKKNGDIFNSTIMKPLIRNLACRFITSGVVEIKKADNTSQLDYGDGQCDDIATVTKNGKSYEIQIRQKKRK